MAGDDYRIRPYRPTDREGFLSLYETVWGHRKDGDWFEWRFRENPYRDGVQMVVAEADGDIVGAEPLLPFALRAGDRRLAAYQPVDWIVHPDHRRQGLFTRMTERVLQRHAGDADLLFNFPNDALLPGLERFDWRVVGDLPTCYRVQNPRALLADSVGPAAQRVLGPVTRVASAATKLGLAALDRYNAPSADGTVSAYDGVPVETLATLYAAASPDAIHVPRDRAFLDWRFANPNWEVTTYVAADGGDLVASLVAATEHRDGCTTTTLLDSQPMTDVSAHPDAVEQLLVRLLRDHRHADVVKAPGWYAPHRRRRYGFWHDSAIAASRLPSVSRVAVRPLTTGAPDADAWLVDGCRLTDRENWRLTLADMDIE